MWRSALLAEFLAAVVVLVALPCAQAGMPVSVILNGEVGPYGLFGATGGEARLRRPPPLRPSLRR